MIHDLAHLVYRFGSPVLGHRRRAFFRIHRLLAHQILDQTNLSRLLLLQTKLVSEIRRVEKAIRKSKSRLRKAQERGHDAAINPLLEHVEELRLANYAWHMIGDAIAFLYLDKYALKQVYYKTFSPEPKQDAGFLTDKAGFAAEMQTLKSLARDGTPALLCDLTNTIRHGDVCVLLGPEPKLIEVKAGAKGSRGRRQGADIAKLHEFFENDVVRNLRGHAELHRVEGPSDEQTYSEEMSRCIDHARTHGWSVRNPEPGLLYAAMFENAEVADIVGEIKKLQSPVVFQLNEYKANRNWSPYYPFTLSILSPRDVFDFIRGQFILLVAFDIELMRQEIERRAGCTASLHPGDDYPIKYSAGPSTPQGGVSMHFLTRIGLEFLSPSSAVDHLTSSLSGVVARLQAPADGRAMKSKEIDFSQTDAMPEQSAEGGVIAPRPLHSPP
ncbi:MAG: hypothetical protein U1E03_14300 [Hyphomonadaceae bacterium]